MKAELRISKFEIGPAPDAGLPTAAMTLRNSGPLVATMANSIITLGSAHMVGPFVRFDCHGQAADQWEERDGSSRERPRRWPW